MTNWSITSDPSQPHVATPSHLAWDFVIKDNDVLASIKSRKKRRTAKRIQEILEENQLRFEFSPLTEQAEYLYLKDFFASTHAEKEHTLSVTLSDSWLTNKQLQMREVEKLLIFHGEKLVGMKMYSYDKDGFYLSYKASLQEYDTASELGFILDFLSFQRANELGYTRIKTGKGKNLFGLSMQLSLLRYKCSLGLELHIPENAEHVLVAFAPAPLEAPFVLMTYQEVGTQLYFVHPDEETSPDIEPYIPINVRTVPISYSNFCLQQKRMN